jgi:hypothetical protein
VLDLISTSSIGGVLDLISTSSITEGAVDDHSRTSVAPAKLGG